MTQLTIPRDLYRPSLALVTDLYQLTMAYGYWKAGIHRDQAVFTLSFRNNPFAGGYTVACGLGYLLGYLDGYRFDGTELDYLAALRGNDGQPLFEEGFLRHLSELRLSSDIDSVPEGTAVFPHEPLLRVRGPLLEAQILETPLLNIINHQTLIATKAARICLAADGDPVLEFGLRRAPGIDGALAASRAAYVGGCAATSNLLAGRLFGIPVRGTHAHSWVMSFDSEPEAFEAYAAAMPNNCVFLVDTFDSLEGVRNAVRTGQRLRERGYEMVGIRLDSGDLAYLSNEARRILDEGGFPKTAIFASNNLDEYIIESLKDQGARIDSWGVGTKLVSGDGEPALSGVYKLSAIKRGEGPWQYRIKLSEQVSKISNPGVLQVRRFRRDGLLLADAVYDELTGIGEGCVIVDPLDMTRRKRIMPGTEHEDLLQPVVREGRVLPGAADLQAARRHRQRQLAELHESIKRLTHPHQYPVGLERRLHELKTRLILRARGETE